MGWRRKRDLWSQSLVIALQGGSRRSRSTRNLQRKKKGDGSFPPTFQDMNELKKRKYDGKKHD